MYLNRVKNFIITFFVILAVYQTAGLWFEDFSGRSLFYSVFLNKEPASQKEEIKFNLESIIINKGNNEFIKKANNINESSFKDDFDNAIKTALKEGSFSQSGEVDWSRELSSRCVIYDFGYLIDGKELKAMFNAKTKLHSKIGSFDIIIITPDVNVPESMRVSFINSAENKGYYVELNNDKVISKTYSTMTGLAADENRIYYISSVQNGFELFKPNVFLPKWSGALIDYPSLSITNPMEEDGGVLLMTLEKNINHFFANPAVKWTSTVNDIYTYSDESTVVKYYTTGVLEYSNYKSGGLTKPDFSRDYLTALSFINKDVNINNEYYLSRYAKNDEEIVFYFDYKINDNCIRLSKESEKRTGMSSMIEVTVSNSKVVRYKRLVYEFNNSENAEYEVAEVDFLSAIDKVYEANPELKAQQSQIENIELCYNADNTKEKITLSWFITINGEVYVVDAKN